MAWEEVLVSHSALGPGSGGLFLEVARVRQVPGFVPLRTRCKVSTCGAQINL